MITIFAPFKLIGKFSLKHKRIIILFLILWSFWFAGLGVVGGWFLAKGSLAKFPELLPSDRLLILAPHIDDEIICCSGIIQKAVSLKAKVKIVYATNGDDNIASVAKSDKNYKPEDFVFLGEERMKEGKKATSILGLNESDLIFLGYPDRGILSMFSKNYDKSNPYTSQGTRMSFNPYSNTYQKEQLYAGSNLYSDLNRIIDDYKPTKIFVSHLRDGNSDHKGLYLFLEKIVLENNVKSNIYSYLVHFRMFPIKKSYNPIEFLYPPKKLFTQTGWYSYLLSMDEENNKLKSVEENKTQLENIPFYDLLHSFVKRNEIFEELEI